MSTDYSRAPEVEQVARQVMRDVEDHWPLQRAEFLFVFRDPPANRHGRTVMASARKLSGLAAYLTRTARGEVDDDANSPLFVIEVARKLWRLLTDEERVALIDHELCHCEVDETDQCELVYRIRGHDLEEFRAVVARRGLWYPDVRRFAAEISTQLTLDEAALVALQGPES